MNMCYILLGGTFAFTRSPGGQHGRSHTRTTNTYTAQKGEANTQQHRGVEVVVPLMLNEVVVVVDADASGR